MRTASCIIFGGLLALTQITSAAAHEWASVEILTPNVNVQLDGLKTTFGSVPELTFIERSGRKMNLALLRGKVWVADLIYTTCPDTCPTQTADMAKLQEQWIKYRELELVSISVDPEHDTPRVLSRYADQFRADAKRWLFLTGGKQEIARLVHDGFHLAATPATNGDKDSAIIVHSPSLVLVDRQMQIRGYYDSRYPAAMERLTRDLGRLLRDNLGAGK
jgi:protein SCO1